MVLAGVLCSGCAASTEDRLDALEASVNDLRMQEVRLALVEDKVNSLSASMAYSTRSGAGQPAAQEGRPAAKADKPAKPAKQAASSAAPESSGQAEPASSPQAAKKEGAEGQGAYASALKTFEANKFDAALGQFTLFVRDYPSSSLAPNAYYWMGECHYGMKRYDSAILSFKDVVTKYPKHPKAAAAMLKAGFAYERLGDKGNAQFYLETLVQDFPGSEPAALAKKRLPSLR